MAELLDQEHITEALAALPGWGQEDTQLVRRVPVAADARASLEQAVSRVLSGTAPDG